jgi:hypothetical protein
VTGRKDWDIIYFIIVSPTHVMLPLPVAHTQCAGRGVKVGGRLIIIYL